jgi:hypothetical protein
MLINAICFTLGHVSTNGQRFSVIKSVSKLQHFTPKKRWVFGTMGTLIGVILGLICSETLLTILNKPRFYQAHPGVLQVRYFQLFDGTTILSNLPLAKITFEYDSNPRGYFEKGNKVVHTTNSMGFRGSEFTVNKEINEKKIVFLGDSITFGEGVKDKDTFAARMIDKLNGSGSKDLRFVGYNFGVGSLNTEQSVTLLKKVSIESQPDIVILTYVLNDAEPPLFIPNLKERTLERLVREEFVPEGISDKTPPESVFYALRTTRLVWKILRNRRAKEKTIAFYKSLYSGKNEGWEVTKRSLKEYGKFCEEKALTCYLVIFPLLIDLDAGYPFYAIHEDVKHAVDSNVISVIDLLPLFSGKKPNKLWVHPTDQHPNEIAHAIVADALSLRLTKDGETP